MNRGQVVAAVSLGLFGTAAVLAGTALLSVLFALPPHGAAPRLVLVAVACLFGVASALVRGASGPARAPGPVPGRLGSILVVGYLLGVLLPAIRLFLGQETIGWALANSTAVVGATVAVALFTAERRDGHRR